MKDIVFVGSNLAIHIYTEVAAELGYTVAGILDEDYYKSGKASIFRSVPVIGSQHWLNPEHAQFAELQEQYCFFPATNWIPAEDPVNLRNTDKRRQILEYLNHLDLEVASLIAPQTAISPSAQIGKGCFIGPFCVIEPDVRIGNYSNIWNNVTVGHDSVLGENCVMQRHTECYGEVRMGKNVYMGTNSGFIENLQIGDNVWVQPGIRVCRNVENNEKIGSTRKSLRRTVPYYATNP